MKYLICTNNANKVKEFRDMSLNHEFYCLKDENILIDIPETGQTFKENAQIKLETILKQYPTLISKYDVIIAEDSGLCVHSLNNSPGIYSARYAGEKATDKENNTLLLTNLKDVSERSCYYTIIIAAYYNSIFHYFEGTLNGEITDKPSGNNGFGYDPIFIPSGYDKTFGDLSIDVKKEISHRSRAIKLMFSALD